MIPAHGTKGYKFEDGQARCADGTLLIYKPFRRPSRELCFLRIQLQQALLYEVLPAVSGHRSACIKAFDNIADGAHAFVRYAALIAIRAALGKPLFEELTSFFQTINDQS